MINITIFYILRIYLITKLSMTPSIEKIIFNLTIVGNQRMVIILLIINVFHYFGYIYEFKTVELWNYHATSTYRIILLST